MDCRGEIQAAITEMLAKRPDLSFEEVSARLPVGWDSYRFFAIGPRHLEAVLTRTCQVLVEGEYDGLLRAGDHYVPVRPDLGNLADALAIVRDAAAVDRMTQRAFEDLFLAGKLTYATAACSLMKALNVPAAPRSGDTWLAIRLRISGAIRLAGRVVRGAWRRTRRKLGLQS